MQEKNYYVLLPLKSTNISQVYLFIQNESTNFENIGGNDVLLPFFYPNNVALLCYQFELKESLVVAYRTQLELMDAEIYESADSYLSKHPPINIENIDL